MTWVAVGEMALRIARFVLEEAERRGEGPDEYEAARIAADAAEIAKFGRSSRQGAPSDG